MMSFRLSTTALFGLLCASFSQAAIITLVNPSNPIFQQNSQNPCVIGDNPCGPDNPIPYTSLPNGNPDSYDLNSPTYTVQTILNIVNGPVFSLALDLNNTSAPQTVDLVEMYLNNVLLDSWTGPLSLVAANNGSGFSDILFTGFDLTGKQTTDSVYFRLKMSVVNDGPEALFLISNNSPAVPEPSTALLLGGALTGLAIWRRRASRSTESL